MRTSRAAIQEVEQRKRNGEERGLDDMQKTAEQLVRIAILALMRMRDVDWETAASWVHRSAAAVDIKKPPLASG